MSYQVDYVITKLLYLFDCTLNKINKYKCPGFNRFDESICSSIARYFLMRGTITEKQWDVVEYRLHKYEHHKLPKDWDVKQFIQDNRPWVELPKGQCLIEDEEISKSIISDAIPIGEDERKSHREKHLDWKTIF